MLDVELIRSTVEPHVQEIKSIGFTNGHDNQLKLSLVWVDLTGDEKQWNYVFQSNQLGRIETETVVALVKQELE